MKKTFQLTALLLTVVLVPTQSHAMLRTFARIMLPTAAIAATAYAQKARCEATSKAEKWEDLSSQEQETIKANVERVAQTGKCNGCDLRFADMREAVKKAKAQNKEISLPFATLYKANFEGTDLEGAMLGGTDLTGANLIKTKHKTANFFGADFLDAKFEVEIDAAQYPELTKFVNKFRCPNDIKRSECHLKYSQIDRIINAARMKKCIEINELDHLRVADKCLYPSVDNELLVLSQTVAFKPGDRENAKLSLSEVQQLVKLAEETGFRDWARNFDWDINNKLTFFDTENNSFAIGMIRGVKGMELPAHCKFNFVASLAIYRDSMKPDAQKFFNERLNYLLNSDEGKKEAPRLPLNQKYDDSQINFEKVKEEYRNWKKTHEDE